MNPWLLLALLLAGSVAFGTAVLFAISAVMPDQEPVTAINAPPTQVSPRAADGGPRDEAPPRLPLRSEKGPSRPAGTGAAAPKLAPAEGAAPATSDEGLAVTSTPPETAHKGATLRYQMRVRSRNGGVRYRVITGPPGMRILPDGELVWRVPPTAHPEQKVTVLVTDVDGNEVAHRFTLKVVSAAKD